MATQVKQGERFAPPPPPQITFATEAPASLAHYQVYHSRVGLWFAGEIVDRDDFEGGQVEIARLLEAGAIGPVRGEGQVMSRADAWQRSGGPMIIQRPTTEAIVAAAVAALKG